MKRALLLLLPALMACACARGTASTSGPSPLPATSVEASVPVTPQLNRRDVDEEAGEPPHRPATAYCGDGACPTYDAALARVRKQAKSGGYCRQASAGTCGSSRYVTFSDGFSLYTEYYAPDGSFESAVTWEDFAPHGAVFGSPPRGTLTVSEVLCGADAGRTP